MRALLCLFAAIVALAGVAPAACAAEVLHFTTAEFAPAGMERLPADGVTWSRASLPDRWSGDRPGIGSDTWYRIGFDLAAPAREPWMAYLPRLARGGELYVNGELIGAVPRSDAAQTVRWIRPHAFAIPPSQLRSGPNTVLVRMATAPGIAMSSVYLGPATQVRPLHDQRLFWVHTSAQITAIVTIIAGALVMAVWMRRGMVFDYGLFGLASLFWGIRTLNFVVEVYPQGLWHPVRIAYFAATGGFVICMMLFMLRFAQIRRPLVERALIAYWPTGPLVLLALGPSVHDTVDRYYQGGLLVIAVMMFATTLYAGWRLRTAGAIALCTGVLVGVLFGVHDYFNAQGLFTFERPYLLHFAADLLLLIIGVLLADRFVASQREVEHANENLERKVADRERELAENYARLGALERERAAGEERQRIMQDMHDGLGSQLISSLTLVERGALDRDGMARVLRESIDDMRLAIDTLAPGRDGLLESLGNLRYRLEPRFQLAGADLRFEYADVPDRIDLPPADALQILRILQEALANALKHARASRIVVRLGVDAQNRQLAIAVADDGCGFDAASAHGGRGLGGMRRRAARLGASFEVASSASGTSVRLSYPLPPSA